MSGKETSEGLAFRLAPGAIWQGCTGCGSYWSLDGEVGSCCTGCDDGVITLLNAEEVERFAEFGCVKPETETFCAYCGRDKDPDRSHEITICKECWSGGLTFQGVNHVVAEGHHQRSEFINSLWIASEKFRRRQRGGRT